MITLSVSSILLRLHTVSTQKDKCARRGAGSGKNDTTLSFYVRISTGHCTTYERRGYLPLARTSCMCMYSVCSIQSNICSGTTAQIREDTFEMVTLQHTSAEFFVWNFNSASNKHLIGEIDENTAFKEKRKCFLSPEFLEQIILLVLKRVWHRATFFWHHWRHTWQATLSVARCKTSAVLTVITTVKYWGRVDKFQTIIINHVLFDRGLESNII